MNTPDPQPTPTVDEVCAALENIAKFSFQQRGFDWEATILRSAIALLRQRVPEDNDNKITIIAIQSLSENWATGMSSAQECMAEIHTMLLDERAAPEPPHD